MNWNNAMSYFVAYQQDIHEFVSRIHDMAAPIPMDVTLEYFDGTVYTIPNFAKMLGDIKNNTPSFNFTQGRLLTGGVDGNGIAEMPDWGEDGQILTSRGAYAQPVWESLPTIDIPDNTRVWTFENVQYVNGYGPGDSQNVGFYNSAVDSGQYVLEIPFSQTNEGETGIDWYRSIMSIRIARISGENETDRLITPITRINVNPFNNSDCAFVYFNAEEDLEENTDYVVTVVAHK